jgi:hypothetical protein
MSRWVSGRRGEEAVELLDDGQGSEEEIIECYHELGLVNRWLGGFRATFEPLDRWTGRSGPATILDVAGGDGDYAEQFLDWAGSRGTPSRVYMVDWHPVTVRLARERRLDGLLSIRGDALALPFGDQSFDLVHSAAFFHHLSMARACDLLAEMCRVSQRLVIVNDLVRSRLAQASIWALTRGLSTNRLIRHDGPLSVSKAFLPRELEAVARTMEHRGYSDFRWHMTRTFPYRMALVGARLPGENR